MLIYYLLGPVNSFECVDLATSIAAGIFRLLMECEQKSKGLLAFPQEADVKILKEKQKYIPNTVRLCPVLKVSRIKRKRYELTVPRENNTIGISLEEAKRAMMKK